MTYKEQLLDPRWQKKRLEILNRDEWSCQWCGEKTKTLHIHHFCYRYGKMAWESENDEMITLCNDCHKVTHITTLTPIENKLIDLLRIGAETQNSFYKYLLTVANQEILKENNNG